MSRHPCRQADAAVRCAETRDITGVHAVAAVESHEVRHTGAIKMSACGLCVFAHVDVGFYHLAPVVDVVAEFTRDVVFVLLDYMITTWRRVEASLSSRNRAFPNQPVALIKVGALFAHMDDDLGWPGKMVAAPVAFGRGRTGKEIGQPLRAGSEFFPKICAAAEDDYGANRGKDWDDFRDLHWAADASRIVRKCNRAVALMKLWEVGDANAAISMPLPNLPAGRLPCRMP